MFGGSPAGAPSFVWTDSGVFHCGTLLAIAVQCRGTTPSSLLRPCITFLPKVEVGQEVALPDHFLGMQPLLPCPHNLVRMNDTLHPVKGALATVPTLSCSWIPSLLDLSAPPPY